jgi:hypothetical protein
MLMSFVTVNKETGEEHAFSGYNQQSVAEAQEKASAKLVELADRGITAYQYREGIVG